MNKDRDASQLFVSTFGVTEAVALRLVEGGFTSVEEVAYVPIGELLQTPGIEQNLLAELREKARAHLAL